MYDKDMVLAMGIFGPVTEPAIFVAIGKCVVRDAWLEKEIDHLRRFILFRT